MSTTPTTAGAAGSFWLTSTDDAPPYADPVDSRVVDVAVVGAGIAGLTTALLLARAGRTVALLEAARVGSGVSGASTAKVTSLHGLAYGELRSRVGEERTFAYGDAQERALDWMRTLVSAEAIDCDWVESDAVTWTADQAHVPEIDAEVDAATAAGLPVERVADTDLPLGAVAAVRATRQAGFHPRRYLLGLARLLQDAGGSITEAARVTGVSGHDPVVVETTQGTLRAADVVIATHAPILDRSLFFARVEALRSYAIGATVSRASAPDDMSYGVDDPMRSVRAHPLDDDTALLVVGGEGHGAGRASGTSERFDELERWTHATFPGATVTHRWSAQDLKTADGLPYVGRYGPVTQGLWVATGFRKWGYTNGTAAAHILVRAITGDEPDPAARTFDSNRFDPVSAGPRLASMNAKVGVHLVGDRVATQLRRGSSAELAPGEGAVVARGAGSVAAYRDEAGRLYECSATCTHLGCEVRFNDAERSWDCPCHGSRFAVDGSVLEGPAVTPLRRLDDGSA